MSPPPTHRGAKQRLGSSSWRRARRHTGLVTTRWPHRRPTTAPTRRRRPLLEEWSDCGSRSSSGRTNHEALVRAFGNDAVAGGHVGFEHQPASIDLDELTRDVDALASAHRRRVAHADVDADGRLSILEVLLAPSSDTSARSDRSWTGSTAPSWASAAATWPRRRRGATGRERQSSSCPSSSGARYWAGKRGSSHWHQRRIGRLHADLARLPGAAACRSVCL